MSIESVRSYCAQEIARMAHAHEQFGPLLEKMASAADAPLLRTTLLAHRDANGRMYDDAMVVVGLLGVAKLQACVEVDAVVTLAAQALNEEDVAVKDLRLAQGAIRIEAFVQASYAGISTWLLQLREDEAAGRVESILVQLGAGERHLEGLRSSLSSLFEGGGHAEPLDRTVRRRAPNHIGAFTLKKD